MRMLSQSEFNAEVMRALEKNSQEWLTLINRRVLRFVWGLKRGNADVRDSPLYHDLHSGRLSYRMYCFTKA